MAIVVSLGDKKGKRHTPEQEARNPVAADVVQRLPRGGIVAQLQPWPLSLLASVFGLQTSADSAPHTYTENTPGSFLQITFLKGNPCAHVRPAFTPIGKELLDPLWLSTKTANRFSVGCTCNHGPIIECTRRPFLTAGPRT